MLERAERSCQHIVVDEPRQGCWQELTDSIKAWIGSLELQSDDIFLAVKLSFIIATSDRRETKPHESHRAPEITDA